jgi:hypothetical protein
MRLVSSPRFARRRRFCAPHIFIGVRETGAEKTALRSTRKPRSTWTFELDVRPFESLVGGPDLAGADSDGPQSAHIDDGDAPPPSWGDNVNKLAVLRCYRPAVFLSF